MFRLPDLPYDYDALEPVISAETLEFHHDKHHAKYVKVLNDLLQEAGESPDSLESVVRAAAGDPAAKKLFNNAAQTWNHTFFWTCMTPEAGEPGGDLAQAIGRDFGGLDQLKAAFVKEGETHFASGWVWLVAERGKLKVISTHDADDTLPREGITPLLVCDVWEHAYYLDFQNDRKSFLERWFDALPNWEFAAQQFAAAQGQGKVWRHPGPEAEDQAAGGTVERGERSEIKGSGTLHP